MSANRCARLVWYGRIEKHECLFARAEFGDEGPPGLALQTYNSQEESHSRPYRRCPRYLAYGSSPMGGSGFVALVHLPSISCTSLSL